jgi:hypothetical protein
MASETEELSDTLSEFQRRFAQLPDVEEPPKTIFQVINRSSRETYWNRLLSYLLDPTEPHGFGTELLERFLFVLEENPGLGFVFDRRHFEKIEVESEVTTPEGNVPDILIRSGREWFICIEMKVGATEGENQTERYANDEYVGDIRKNEFPEEGRHYVYLAEKDAADASANEFVDVAWREVVRAIERFRTQSRGRHPSKSNAQLDDFLDTIRSEMNMTENEFEESQMAKMRLYLEYAESIDEAQDAFESVYEREKAAWKERFLDDFKPPNWTDEWNCDPSKYGQIYKNNWRLDENLVPTNEELDISLQFVHFIRNAASFRDGTLKFELKWPGGGDFWETFHDRFHSDETVERLRPVLNEYDINRITDSSKSYTRKEYNFDQNQLPDSYYKTLVVAFEEHQEIGDIASNVLGTTLDELR